MMGWMAPERHLGARMVVGETHHQEEPSMSEALSRKRGREWRIG
jgi:hypothetical protein